MADIIQSIHQHWAWFGLVLVWAPYGAIRLENRLHPEIPNDSKAFFFYCLAGTIGLAALRFFVWRVTGEL